MLTDLAEDVLDDITIAVLRTRTPNVGHAQDQPHEFAGEAAARLACTCRAFGIAEPQASCSTDAAPLSRVTRLAQTECALKGVTALCEASWTWPRMLRWVCQAVRVGPRQEVKSIAAGVSVAARANVAGAGEPALVEGSALVLVEGGAYSEPTVMVDGGSCMSIWADWACAWRPSRCGGTALW